MVDKSCMCVVCRGQPVVCQLLPNLDRTYALVLGGRALLHCPETSQIRQLFHSAFPEVLFAPPLLASALDFAPLDALY